MAVALESVVKQLTDSGIIAQGQLENFIPPKASPKTVDELIAQLVKENHLTKFQAQTVGAGKAKSLILGEYTISITSRHCFAIRNVSPSPSR